MIDLREYVPEFLRDVKELRHLFRAEEEELRRVYERLDGVWSDSLIKEAGLSGIRRYESLLGLRPYPGDSLKERRAAALFKWNQQLPYTLPRLAERLDAAVGEEAYELYVRHRAYELELLVMDETYRTLRSVRDMTREMIPANLMFIFAGKYPVHMPVDIAASSRMELMSDFYARYNREFLYLDGTWLLDGGYALNGYKEKEALDLYPARLTVLSSYGAPCFCGVTGVESVAQARAEPGAQMVFQLQGEAKENPQSSNELILQGVTQAGPGVNALLRVEKDLWHLDGTYLLDGTKLLDAEIFEYCL